MKTILFFAFLSFASAIMVVPHDRNITDLGTLEKLETNYTDSEKNIHLAHPISYVDAHSHEDNSKYHI